MGAKCGREEEPEEPQHIRIVIIEDEDDSSSSVQSGSGGSSSVDSSSVASSSSAPGVKVNKRKTKTKAKAKKIKYLGSSFSDAGPSATKSDISPTGRRAKLTSVSQCYTSSQGPPSSTVSTAFDASASPVAPRSKSRSAKRRRSRPASRSSSKKKSKSKRGPRSAPHRSAGRPKSRPQSARVKIRSASSSSSSSSSTGGGTKNKPRSGRTLESFSVSTSVDGLHAEWPKEDGGKEKASTSTSSRRRQGYSAPRGGKVTTTATVKTKTKVEYSKSSKAPAAMKQKKKLDSSIDSVDPFIKFQSATSTDSSSVSSSTGGTSGGAPVVIKGRPQQPPSKSINRPPPPSQPETKLAGKSRKTKTSMATAKPKYIADSTVFASPYRYADVGVDLQLLKLAAASKQPKSAASSTSFAVSSDDSVQDLQKSNAAGPPMAPIQSADPYSAGQTREEEADDDDLRIGPPITKGAVPPPPPPNIPRPQPVKIQYKPNSASSTSSAKSSKSIGAWNALNEDTSPSTSPSNLQQKQQQFKGGDTIQVDGISGQKKKQSSKGKVCSMAEDDRRIVERD